LGQGSGKVVKLLSAENVAVQTSLRIEFLRRNKNARREAPGIPIWSAKKEAYIFWT
jgi:hypothetical protein